MSFVLFVLAGCGGKSKDELYAEGNKQLKEGNPGGAIVLFKNALEKDQNFQEARVQLAAAYMAVGKFEQAEKEFLKLLKQNPSRAEIPLSLAKVYNSLGKPELAIEHASAYLRTSPDSSEALEVLGMSHSLKGMPGDAERYLLQALQKEPGRISAKLDLSRVVMAQSGRDAEARALIDEVLKADPRNVKAYTLLAAYELSVGKRDRAIEIYRKLAELLPNDPAPLYRQGVIIMEGGDLAQADRIAEKLAAQFPGSSESPRLKGFLAYQRKNYTEAIAQLQNSIKITPSLEGIYYLGMSLYGSGDLESALSQFRRIIDHKPDFLQARILTAMVLLTQKRIDDSINEIRRVIEVDSRNALAHNVLGSAYIAKGLHEEGARELSRATELDPKLVDAHLRKGVYNLSRGNAREAEDDFSTAVRVAPDLLNSRLLLAFYYMRNKQSEKAMATLKEGLSGKKDDAPLYNTMAALMFRGQKSAEAVRYLQKANEVNPEFLPSRFNLATHYASTGDLDRAMAEYTKITRIDPRSINALVGMGTLSELKGKESDALGWFTKAKETGEYNGYLVLAAYHDKKGKRDTAVSVLDEAIKAQPKKTEAFVMKGRILVAQNKIKDAVKTYTDLESIAPEDGLANKVSAYVQMKDSNKALEEARRAVTLRPNSAFGHSLVASVYASQGDLARAIQSVRDGLRVEPGNIRVSMQLGEYLARSGNSDAAMNEYTKILRSKPDYVAALFAQGALLESGGKKKEAVAKYQQLLQKSDNYVPALNNLAYLYADGYGPRSEALRLAMAALKQEPGNAGIADTYGYALLMNGRKEEARKVLEKVTSALPNNPSIRFHLALAYNETGDRQKAVAALNEALKRGEFPEATRARKLLAELSGGQSMRNTGRN